MKNFAAILFITLLAHSLTGCANKAMNAQINREQNKKLDKVNIATYNIEDEEGVYEDPELFFNLLGSEIEFNQSQQALIDFGRQYLGATYVFGEGNPEVGFDCSGFTQYAYKKALNKNLPRTALQMSEIGKKIEVADLKAGDLVFFNTRGFKFSHVGIYIGEGRFFHASTKTSAIIIGDMNKEYFAKRYNGARRVLG